MPPARSCLVGTTTTGLVRANFTAPRTHSPSPAATCAQVFFGSFAGASITRFMLLHDSRSDDGIKSFFQEVHELYMKILYLPGSRIASSHFDAKVRTLARKYL